MQYELLFELFFWGGGGRMNTLSLYQGNFTSVLSIGFCLNVATLACVSSGTLFPMQCSAVLLTRAHSTLVEISALFRNRVPFETTTLCFDMHSFFEEYVVFIADTIWHIVTAGD